MMPRIREYIREAANLAGLEALLVEALVEQESSGNSWAHNPEPRYRYLWDVSRRKPFRGLTALEIASETPPVDFPTLAGDRDQEWWNQQASWGLMQVMGAVARELGFRGPYLTELCDPRVNLPLGCEKLAQNRIWAGGDVFQALAAYNAGRGGWHSPQGQAYAASVLKRKAALLKGLDV